MFNSLFKQKIQGKKHNITYESSGVNWEKAKKYIQTMFLFRGGKYVPFYLKKMFKTSERVRVPVEINQHIKCQQSHK